MDKFYRQLLKQLNNLFFLNKEEEEIINEYKDYTNDRFLYNCSHLRNKYYKDINNLSPLHSGQYTMFLYFLANTIYKNTNKRLEICDKIYNLLKIISCADLYYEIELPEIFMLEHPVGSVMGRAKYGNYFNFMQGCTVGGNHNDYPELGNSVIMYSNSKILGKCKIGNNVLISANTYIKNTDIPDNSIVFGSTELSKDSFIIKPLTEEKIKMYFDEIFL